VYRGSGIPELEGRFVFGDVVNGRIFYADADELLDVDDDDASTTAQIHELGLLLNGQPVTLLQQVRLATGNLTLGRTDLRFGVDAGGELYVTTKQDGFIRRLLRDARRDCADGYDDDGDGFADFPDDPGCRDVSSPRENPQCQDGVNNDGQLGTDFDGGESALGVGQGDPDGADPQCVNKPWKNSETVAVPSRCGLGFELSGLLTAWLLFRSRTRSRARKTARSRLS
jgi:hypothetical protein